MLGAINESEDQHAKRRADFVTGGSGVKTQIGCDLLVAAAPAVQLVSDIANDFDQLLFDEVMHIFGFTVLEKFGRRSCRLPDLLETVE